MESFIYYSISLNISRLDEHIFIWGLSEKVQGEAWTEANGDKNASLAKLKHGLDKL
jgi:hypothetical protein